jgi:hypothetical protein
MVVTYDDTDGTGESREHLLCHDVLQAVARQHVLHCYCSDGE